MIVLATGAALPCKNYLSLSTVGRGRSNHLFVISLLPSGSPQHKDGSHSACSTYINQCPILWTRDNLLIGLASDLLLPNLPERPTNLKGSRWGRALLVPPAQSHSPSAKHDKPWLTRKRLDDKRHFEIRSWATTSIVHVYFRMGTNRVIMCIVINQTARCHLHLTTTTLLRFLAEQVSHYLYAQSAKLRRTLICTETELETYPLLQQVTGLSTLHMQQQYRNTHDTAIVRRSPSLQSMKNYSLPNL